MISVACSAGRRAEVASNYQSVVVNAGAVLRELIGGEGIFLHVGSVGMAARTSLGDVERMNFRTSVAGRPKSMYAVAINTNCHFGVTFGE